MTDTDDNAPTGLSPAQQLAELLTEQAQPPPGEPEPDHYLTDREYRRLLTEIGTAADNGEAFGDVLADAFTRQRQTKNALHAALLGETTPPDATEGTTS
ncbi:MAG: hypothetical protein ACR2MP_01985 [Streptosporangiaceae bacterium]